MPASFVTEQLDALFADLDVAAVKVGMLGGADVVEAVADAARRHGIRRLVVDPVMVATSGDRLVDDATVEAIRDRLLPLADVVTPNLPETAALLGVPAVAPEEAADAAAELHAKGPAALVKGGHAAGPDAVDVLADDDGLLELRERRVETANTHGTGCTLSSAIAAGLGHGRLLRDAVRDAKTYLTEALRAADQLHVGTGHGPVHHFHAWWTPEGTPA